MEELKPCPFCGGKAEMCEQSTRRGKETVKSYVVACGHCISSMGMSAAWYTEENAVTAWNRRTKKEEPKEADLSKYHRTYNPCDECPHGIEKRDGSGNDSMCKICEFAELVNRSAAPENESEIVQKLWALYDKFEDAEHTVCGDAAKLLLTAPENPPLTCEGCKHADGSAQSGFINCLPCIRNKTDRYEPEKPEARNE